MPNQHHYPTALLWAVNTEAKERLQDTSSLLQLSSYKQWIQKVFTPPSVNFALLIVKLLNSYISHTSTLSFHNHKVKTKWVFRPFYLKFSFSGSLLRCFYTLSSLQPSTVWCQSAKTHGSCLETDCQSDKRFISKFASHYNKSCPCVQVWKCNAQHVSGSAAA